MARNFNFRTTLSLNSKEFKKGIADIKASISSLKNTFMGFAGAMGVGLGLSNIIKSAKDTALQLSVAEMTLKNVSTQTDAAGRSISFYNENLEFAHQLADKYGQDLISIIHNFGQFTAAANQVKDANGRVILGLGEQIYIYEQLVRAAATYHLSADRTRDMLTAVTQMMSKGKVASEELRRQLGNALPGAFGMMANAMGVSNAELEDMMRKGQLLASDAIPKFARELEKVTQNAEFDSVQSSINRLHNAWTVLVEDLRTGDLFKELVDAAAKGLRGLSKNIKLIGNLIKYTLLTVGANALGKFISKAYASGKALRASWKNTFDYLRRNDSGEFQKLKGSPYLEVRHGERARLVPSKIDDSQIIQMSMDTKKVDEYAKALKAAKKCNDELLEGNKAYRGLYGRNWLDPKDKKNLQAANKEIDEALDKLNRLSTSTGMADEKIGIFGKTIGYVGVQIKAFVQSVSSMLWSMGAVFAVEGIIKLVQHMTKSTREAKQHMKELAEFTKSYSDAINNAAKGETESERNLNRQLSALQNMSKGDKGYMYALQQINKELDLSGDKAFTIASSYEEIAKAVDKWIAKLKLTSKIQAAISKQTEAESKKQDLNNTLNKLAEDYNKKTNQFLFGNISRSTGEIRSDRNMKDVENYGWIKRNVIPVINEINEYSRIINGADNDIVKWEKLLSDMEAEAAGLQSGQDKGDKKAKGLAKVFEDYNKDKEELARKLEESAITQKEYNEALGKLNKEAFENAAATGELSISSIVDKMDKGKTLTAMEKWYKGIREAAMEAASRTLSDSISEDLLKDIEKDVDAISDRIDEEIDKALENDEKVYKAEVEILIDPKMNVKRGSRDGLFDYNKVISEILEDEVELSEDEAEKVEDLIEQYKELKGKSEEIDNALKKWGKQLAKAKENAKTLTDVMNYAKITEDIEDMRMELSKLAYSSVKDMADSMDRVIRGAKEIKEAFEDNDTSGWEQFMAIFNEIVQIADVVLGIIETIKELQKLTKALDMAEIAQQKTLNTLLAEELALRTAIATVSGGASMAAGGGGIGDFLMKLMNLQGFAKGGIVGGSSTHGDKSLVRANAGEMLLTKSQQGTLWDMLNGKSGVGGNVEFVLRGDQLIGAINNHNSRKRG